MIIFIMSYIKNGALIKLKKGEEAPKEFPSGTGLNFLYKNWDKLDFKPKKDDAATTQTRKKFLSVLSKDEVWLSKVPVIPAFYRDVDMESKRKNDINVFYTKLISNAQVLKAGSALFDMYGMSSSHRKIQDILIELYEYFVTVIGGTRGFLHHYVMGKTTDYSARSVITMPKFNGNTPKEDEVSFTHAALPLAMAIKCGAPFIHYGVKKILEGILSGGNFIYYQNKTGKVERLELAPNVYDILSQSNMERLIDLYDESKEHRLDQFLLPTVGGKKVPCLYLYNDKQNKDVDRIIFGTDPQMEDLILEEKIGAMTLTDLFYMAAENTLKDKIIYITRYPIETMQNIFPMHFNIIPCTHTEERIINGITYKRFPKKIPQGMDLKHFFIDSIRFSPLYNASAGADFDGDMISIQMTFTDEANVAADKYLYSKTNLLNIAGGTMRTFSDVCAQSMFFLTYRKKAS